MIIKNTTVEAVCDWPDGTFIQGGGEGVVIVRGGDNYLTAFVEVHNDIIGFIRGEGETITDAEHAAWAKAQKVLSCESIVRTGDHEWEARGYRNGAGFCKSCNRFGTDVFDVAEVGVPCYVCNVKTNWMSFGTSEDQYLCENHCLPSFDDPTIAAGLMNGESPDVLFQFHQAESRERFWALASRLTLPEIASFTTPPHLLDAKFEERWAWKKQHEQEWADKIKADYEA